MDRQKDGDAERSATSEAIREGLADVAAGRTKSLEEFDRDFRRRHDISVRGIDVLYRDDNLIALDKPFGLLSVPGIGPEKQDSLATRVQAEIPSATVVHRLDMETSGVMLMALDARTHRHLCRQFQQRRVKKRYLAVVAGRVEGDEGEISEPLRKDFDRKPRHKVCYEHGREAITHWRVIERLADRTRVELSPVTGRSHQLRIHLMHIGHPILGDVLYAPDEVLAMSDRLLLHAADITITHPQSHELFTFRSRISDPAWPTWTSPPTC